MSKKDPNSEILKEFQIESKTLIRKMTKILHDCERDFSQVQRLEEYGQNVDRIMGAANTLRTSIQDPRHFIHKIADYSALCKAVGYKASQIKDNQKFFEISVAFLLDATEMLDELFDKLFEANVGEFKSLFSETFLDRLRWISSQFGSDEVKGKDLHRKKPAKLNQEEIDQLMLKLGLS